MIKDMIDSIEYFAQTQADFPVYDCLGERCTYGQLKKDSDSIAAYIDGLGLPEKSPVLVFGAQTYDMLATFVALTKSGHAYIPVDVHSAPERILSIVEITKKSIINALENITITAEKVDLIS